ncbi:hypothetical protein F4677DRAFT_285347 [Hypoxylon crocopeplum]|nr:hypothetical protein F4677DRAFT_285347 [Hypoxylon crocopeplum]
MDGSGGQKELRERSYPRAPSRASTTSTANTQMTPKSANSSSSHLREPTHRSSHPTHKHHHSNCSSGQASTRPMSQLSGEPSEELREMAASTPTSSLLQERLQRERSERQASKLGSDLSASTGDIRDRDVQSSPIRRSATAVGRRQELNSSDEIAKDAGMGARQMEQTLSTLHKQNFDLKLELYHRREKQTALEERVEKLEKFESQNREMMKLHDTIIHELQEKDNALAEAVTLIVGLEARIDDLVRERDMVRQIEASGAYRHSGEPEPDTESAITTTPRLEYSVVPRLTEETTGSLGRMPSFLSERSQQTENLRNVVLRGRSSVMHMRKISGSSVDPSEINRIASPSLSVLSESSFVSIYGAKGGRGKADSQSPGDVMGMDGSQADRSPTPTMKTNREDWNSQMSGATAQLSTGTTGGGARPPTLMQSLNNVLDMDSPLQKLERLEGRVAVVDDTARQPVSNRARGTAAPTPAKPTNPPQQVKSKHEKREALERVLTNYSTHRDFSNPQAFPPTPDTVSSSTLRTHQNLTSSQDSLTKQAGTMPGETLAAVSDRFGASMREPAYQASSYQQTSAAAFSSRTQAPMLPAHADLFSGLSQLAQSIPPRPHSAAETTSSRARTDDFASDSDSDGGADAHSEADSFDYWIKESMKPNKYQAGSSEQSGSGRTTSPDLFAFPSDGQGWGTDVIFGALKGNGYLGSPVSALKRDPIDEMASSLHTPHAEVFDPPMTGPAPPTPNRRSSLHARTGSTAAAPPSGGKLRKNLAKGPGMGWMDGRGRSNSIDSAAQASSARTYAQQPEATTPSKRNQYPPLSGQTPRGRGLGLNSFFRRAGSESFSVPSSATEATFPVPTPTQPQPLLPPAMGYANYPGRSSVPPPTAMPWRPPGGVEDDFKSATPPPIMRSRGHSLLSGSGSTETADPATPHHQVTETTPSTPTTVIPSQGGNASTTPGGAQSASKRKWLGLGIMGTMKNRMG